MRYVRYQLSLLFFLVSATAFAQYDYESEWSRINPRASGEKARLSLLLAGRIYQQAVTDRNMGQQAKAALQYCAYSGVLAGNDPDRMREVIDSFASQQQGAVKAVLLNAKGEYLRVYQLFNRYAIQERKPIIGDTAVSITEWDNQRLLDTINALYKASLAEENILQNTPADQFSPMLAGPDRNHRLRPTLYDLLAWRFVDALTAQPYIYNDPSLFASAATFAVQEAAPELEVYRKLIHLHIQRNNREALLHVDIGRLQHVFQWTRLAERDSLYKRALLGLTEQYAGVYGISTVYFLLAELHSGAEAVAFSGQGMQFFPGSPGHRQCSTLHAKLTNSVLGLTTEKVNIPGEPMLVLVNYKNLKGIHLRIIPLHQYQAQMLDTMKQAAVFQRVTGMPYLRTWYQPVPDPADYSPHKVEIKVDALETGRYMLLASADERFDPEKSLLAAGEIYISNISYVTTDNIHLYALHRKTGQPLSGIQLVVNNEDDSRITHLRTDRNGRVSLKIDADKEPDLTLKWIDGKDTLFNNDYDYASTDNWGSYFDMLDEREEMRENDEQIRVHYYTDREIYRPGQKLYFKGIALTTGKREGGPARPKKGLRLKVYLKDTDRRKVDSLELSSNAWGSFHGEFQLPASLSGGCSISNLEYEGYVYFSVEEYKRPRFKVVLDSVKTVCRTGDTITIKGAAESLAGSPLSNARVTYRVTRESFMQSYERDDIVEKDTVTDGHGIFSFRFVATGKAQPGTYRYRITADVTDVNGETRSGSYSMTIGDATVMIVTNIGEELQRSDLDKVMISTSTTQGVATSMPLKIELFPLQHPGHLMRPRYWEPDQYCMTKEEFHRYFPNDVYKDEDDKATWPKGNPVTLQYVTGGLLSPLASLSLNAGWYEIVISGKDPYGKSVEERRYFRLWDGTAAFPEYAGLHYSYQQVVLPGDKLSLAVVTAGPAFLLQSIQEKSGRSLQTATHRSEGPVTAFIFPMKRRYVGYPNRFSFAYVQDNRLFTRFVDVYVTDRREPLDIKVATHRNKLLPGEEESWQLQISGAGRAELLASMYDASLDEIKKSDWQVPSRRELRWEFRKWDGEDNFEKWSGINNMVKQSDPGWDDDLADYNYLMDGIAAAHTMREAMVWEKRSMSTAALQYTAIYGSSAGLLDMNMFPEQKIPVNIEMLPPPRRNFNETVFFFPHLVPDKKGLVNLRFTMPDALTQWNFRALAHTRDASFGLAKSTVITQKPLMVVPNLPRFLREGDELELGAKISNVTDKQLTGIVKLAFIDDATGQSLDAFSPQVFVTEAGQSSVVRFKVKIPQQFARPLTYRITAVSGSFSDGEEAVVPVLSDRLTVTEHLPLVMSGDGSRNFVFDRLLHADTSTTLQDGKLLFTYNSSPVWSAIQSLPSLMEFPHACAEQTFARLYANAIASQILDTKPGVAAMLKEKKDAALFDPYRLEKEGKTALNSLRAMQLTDGAFPWFSGMRSNLDVTLHILQGFAHLKTLKGHIPGTDSLIKYALNYIDNAAMRGERHFPALPYLYARTAFPQFTPSPATQAVMDSLLEHAQNEELPLYDKGLLAIVLYRNGDKSSALKIMQSLKENAFLSEEGGMYWRDNRQGYGWNEAPVETQSMLIAAFAMITRDTAAVDALKTWLLRKRQTQGWGTTKATTEACYALLATGTDWLGSSPQVEIKAGGQIVGTEALIAGPAVKPAHGNITLTVSGNGNQLSWGAAHWQYFEQADKISASSGALQIQRELLRQDGNALVRIDDQHPLQVGDRVVMRIVVKSNREMEFVHLEDMRPACLEPINVLSGYKWENGIGYYESTKDLATHFFFDRLTVGTHVLEYPLFVSHAGRFTGGISTLQCMYAPEFSAHSEGMVVKIPE
ncbi:alpha-2-macroglobulin [Chitinophaga sp. XS-30]|uniref:alpha-2-macroglobulin family protein n=1 Tax=Chitinophaga sp. XS-30 TaxID=2604421 RepID=UPI0011DD1C54|nr:alpha-2-macroglobulin family protein [Chitinophaga sp. XS-30]QEH39490.1 hypothetical protein FW415_00825 [Chitinophaga sp. XS-30]